MYMYQCTVIPPTISAKYTFLTELNDVSDIMIFLNSVSH